MSEKYRPNSRKGRVYAVFQSEGPEKALTFGVSYGLAEARVRRWIRKWGGTPPASSKVIGKRTVYFKSPDNLIGVVLTEGDQQSLVRWTGGKYPALIGIEQNVSNAELKYVEQ